MSIELNDPENGVELGARAHRGASLHALLVTTDSALAKDLESFLTARGVSLTALVRLLDIPRHCEPIPALALIDLAADRPDPWHRAHRMVRHCYSLGIPVLVFNSRPASALEDPEASNGFQRDRLLGNAMRLLGLGSGKTAGD